MIPISSPRGKSRNSVLKSHLNSNYSPFPMLKILVTDTRFPTLSNEAFIRWWADKEKPAFKSPIFNRHKHHHEIELMTHDQQSESQRISDTKTKLGRHKERTGIYLENQHLCYQAPLYLCSPLSILGRVPSLHYSSCFPHYCHAMGMQTSATTE